MTIIFDEIIHTVKVKGRVPKRYLHVVSEPIPLCDGVNYIELALEKAVHPALLLGCDAEIEYGSVSLDPKADKRSPAYSTYWRFKPRQSLYMSVKVRGEGKLYVHYTTEKPCNVIWRIKIARLGV